MSKLLNLYTQIRDYLCLGLFVALLASSLGWHITSLKLDAARAEITAQKEGRKADQESYKREQAEYTAKAIADKNRIESENYAKAEKADANFGTLLAKYNASLVRFKSTQGSVGRNYLPNPSEASEGGDRSGGSTVVSIDSADTLTIPFRDAQVCAVNTARLQVVHDWAISTGGN